jgi:OFA family oxalate/formate antiporter-like MFS transporter
MTVHSRWFQLVASLVAMIMIANLQYAWTLFVTPLQDGTGWDLADIQFAFMLFILFQTWVQPLDGWLIDRLGPRWFISAAGVLCGIGWAGMGYATSPAMLYALYGLAGIGAAFVYSGSMGSALKWFRTQRGLASGVMAAGFGGGTALFIPVISTLIASYGYRAAFVATGLVQGLAILAIAQVLRHPGPTEGSGGSGVPGFRGSGFRGSGFRGSCASIPRAAGSLTRTPEPGTPEPRNPGTPEPPTTFTTLEMLRAPRFYAVYAMFVLMATGGLLVTANAGPIVESWGLTTAALTLAATFSPVANGASRVFWGWVSDRAGRETTMVAAFALNAICLVLVLLLGPQSTAWFVVTLSLVYFTWGEIFALFPSITADYFGTRHATSNYSVLYTAKGVAAIIGGWCAALLYEVSGTWEAGFYGSAAMALTAAGLAWRLRLSVAGARLATPLAAGR